MMSWLSRHLQTLVGSLGRLSQQPLAASLTILVMGIALALPASLNVLVKNAQAIGGSWQGVLDVSIYLKSYSFLGIRTTHNAQAGAVVYKKH